jgi:hypothetical protein
MRFDVNFVTPFCESKPVRFVGKGAVHLLETAIVFEGPCSDGVRPTRKHCRQIGDVTLANAHRPVRLDCPPRAATMAVTSSYSPSPLCRPRWGDPSHRFSDSQDSWN